MIPKSAGGAIGIDGDETVVVGRIIHPGIFLLHCAVHAGAMKVHHDREAGAGGGLGRDMNQIAAVGVVVLDGEAVITRGEAGPRRVFRPSCRHRDRRQQRQREGGECLRR